MTTTTTMTTTTAMTSLRTRSAAASATTRRRSRWRWRFEAPAEASLWPLARENFGGGVEAATAGRAGPPSWWAPGPRRWPRCRRCRRLQSLEMKYFKNEDLKHFQPSKGHGKGLVVSTYSVLPKDASVLFLLSPNINFFNFFFFFPYFCLFYLDVRLADKILPMLGFEPRISGFRSDRSTHWATTTTCF